MGLLCITGTDAIKFMQGYVTCDLTKLQDGDTAIGAVCNLQGRMLTSFLAFAVWPRRRGSEMQRSLVPSTLEFLKKYIVFSKAELHDNSDSYVCYGSLDHSTETLSDGFIIELHNRKEIWSPQFFPRRPISVPGKMRNIPQESPGFPRLAKQNICLRCSITITKMVSILRRVVTWDRKSSPEPSIVGN